MTGFPHFEKVKIVLIELNHLKQSCLTKRQNYSK
jgi:hypothetical protein